jgi:hypothetical protein
MIQLQVQIEDLPEPTSVLCPQTSGIITIYTTLTSGATITSDNAYST